MLVLSMLSLTRGTLRDVTLKEGALLKLICRNKNVPITSAALMKRLITISQRQGGQCKDYQASLDELDPILSIEDGKHCSSESFELVKSYHFRFVSAPKRLNKRPGQYEKEEERPVYRQLHPDPFYYTINLDSYNEPLVAPAAIRQFFLAYTLQISGLCKKAMLANLEYAHKSGDIKRDENSILSLLTHTSALRNLMMKDLEKTDFDNVLYMPELEGVSDELELSDLKAASKKVYMQTSVTEGSALYALMMDCKNNLRPIYLNLVMPVIKLSKLGYDYLGGELSKDERAELYSIDMKTWLSIVHICEMFHGFLEVREEADKLARRHDLDDSKLDNELSLADSDDSLKHTQNNTVAGQQVDEAQKKKGYLKLISEEDLQKLENFDKVDLPEMSKFTPDVPVQPIGDRLWITSTRELDLELSRKPGHKNPFGWRGFLRRLNSRQKRLLAKLDFNQMNFWRKGGLWYAGIMNLLSVCLGITNLTVAIVVKTAPIG